jgi:uncharacterized protein YndB with AHSA1/START domain
MDADNRVLVMTRIVDSPPALVFQAWTEPERIKQWWGPRGYTTVSCEMDLRPGGAWRVRSRSAEGVEVAERGVFREVASGERLVFTHSWEDPEGKPGLETLVTLTFADEGGKTKLTLHQAVFDTVENRDGHAEGWGESLDMLAEYLANG